MMIESKLLEGFIEQQNRRGIGVTPELVEHLQNVKYDELSWWRKKLTTDPRETRRFNQDFIRALPEYFKERLER